MIVYHAFETHSADVSDSFTSNLVAGAHGETEKILKRNLKKRDS